MSDSKLLTSSGTPAEDANGHKVSMIDPDDKIGGEGLPCESGYRGHTGQQRILTLDQTEIGRKTVCVTISKDSFVVDLEKVDPDEQRQEIFVSLFSDSNVLRYYQLSTNMIVAERHVGVRDYSHPPR